MRALVWIGLILAGCSGGGGDDGGGGGGGGTTAALHFRESQLATFDDVVNNTHVQRMLARANIVGHQGDSPPDVEGIYDVDLRMRINDLVPGTVGATDSGTSTFSNQRATRIDMNDGLRTVRDAWITGSGNNFTIWLVGSEVVAPFDCRIVEVNVISGTVLSNGDIDARVGNVLVGWFGSECDDVAQLLNLGSARNGLGVTISIDFEPPKACAVDTGAPAPAVSSQPAQPPIPWIGPSL